MRKPNKSMHSPIFLVQQGELTWFYGGIKEQFAVAQWKYTVVSG